MWNDFKKFAMKGNVIDLAVGVIIGAAFSKIVSSLVDDIIMPLFGFVLGGINLKGLEWTVNEAAIKYGNFLQTIVDFFIIAFSIFIFVRLISRMRTKNDEVKEQAPSLTNEEKLLMEIRDLLKQTKEGL
ncbi:large conductance mechanosensitive channel [Oikeobacillus pervagus]|uniref:Large-conductance mechanosensitive channel n=1 Tax=Oikeobacillus pervagus TaxID=1325931 RepID=A0AAJ1WJ77_9BACI|nr:large conductance mechanosensitive channel protein MscL [Oikeobacillus pervagus]MDQ0215128.1 large conductance mechanosensitive channel [Oikeobacillus pervagus]